MIKIISTFRKRYLRPNPKKVQKLFENSWVPFILAGVTAAAFQPALGSFAVGLGLVLAFTGAIMFLVAASQKE